jgi:hypothetical protein
MAKLEGKSKSLICYKCHADYEQERNEMSQKGFLLETMNALNSLGKVSQMTVGIDAMDLEPL